MQEEFFEASFCNSIAACKILFIANFPIKELRKKGRFEKKGGSKCKMVFHFDSMAREIHVIMEDIEN